MSGSESDRIARLIRNLAALVDRHPRPLGEVGDPESAHPHVVNVCGQLTPEISGPLNRNLVRLLLAAANPRPKEEIFA